MAFVPQISQGLHENANGKKRKPVQGQIVPQFVSPPQATSSAQLSGELTQLLQLTLPETSHQHPPQFGSTPGVTQPCEVQMQPVKGFTHPTEVSGPPEGMHS